MLTNISKHLVKKAVLLFCIASRPSSRNFRRCPRKVNLKNKLTSVTGNVCPYTRVCADSHPH